MLVYLLEYRKDTLKGSKSLGTVLYALGNPGKKGVDYPGNLGAPIGVDKLDPEYY